MQNCTWPELASLVLCDVAGKILPCVCLFVAVTAIAETNCTTAFFAEAKEKEGKGKAHNGPKQPVSPTTNVILAPLHILLLLLSSNSSAVTPLGNLPPPLPHQTLLPQV